MKWRYYKLERLSLLTLWRVVYKRAALLKNPLILLMVYIFIMVWTTHGELWYKP